MFHYRRERELFPLGEEEDDRVWIAEGKEEEMEQIQTIAHFQIVPIYLIIIQEVNDD